MLGPKHWRYRLPLRLQSLLRRREVERDVRALQSQ